MVAKMMKWSPWPPVSTRKFEAKVVIHKLQGLNLGKLETENGVESRKNLVVEVKWKGQKGISLTKSVKKKFTGKGGFSSDGVCEWNEEFKNLCNLSGFKDGMFHPWEITFSVFNGMKQGRQWNKVLVGNGTLNLSEYASLAAEKELEINIPMMVPTGTVKSSLSLCLSLKLIEVGTIQEPPEAKQEVMESVPQSPSSAGSSSPHKYDLSGLKASLRKVRLGLGRKKAPQEEEGSDGMRRVTSQDSEGNYPFDTDSLDDSEEQQPDNSNRDSSALRSCSYESLARANISGGLVHSNTTDLAGEDWNYYNNQKLDVGTSRNESSTEPECEKPSSVKRGLLPWGKKKLRFKSLKVKGETLLKKDHREDGGDDIDFARRQLSSSDESSFGWNKSDEGSTTSRASGSEFGDDSFAVGSWEGKEVLSRDGQMKLQAQVFFASIDQRSERAAGESACTALVAVIANWLQSNQSEVPIKSEFDSLIRDGSLEWRKLCENEDYKQRFPDKHFDLDTILQAGIRPISVGHEKSFIGFFHPEGLEGSDFDFLHSAMSFDAIWHEISGYAADCSSGESLVYIVSWNDHFFVLKVEQDAYYIIDTLGERLYEGCSEAYILKFDRDTTIKQLPKETKAASEQKSSQKKVKPSKSKEKKSAKTKIEAVKNEVKEEEIVCKGKESCKEYVKSFLAAIPIRELQGDMKNGLMASNLLHQRLQIEFHCTHLTQSAVENS